MRYFIWERIPVKGKSINSGKTFMRATDAKKEVVKMISDSKDKSWREEKRVPSPYSNQWFNNKDEMFIVKEISMEEKQLMEKGKPKIRPSKYKKPLVINGTFADVIRVAVRDDDEVKPGKKKK